MDFLFLPVAIIVIFMGAIKGNLLNMHINKNLASLRALWLLPAFQGVCIRLKHLTTGGGGGGGGGFGSRE